MGWFSHGRQTGVMRPEAALKGDSSIERFSRRQLRQLVHHVAHFRPQMARLRPECMNLDVLL